MRRRRPEGSDATELREDAAALKRSGAAQSFRKQIKHIACKVLPAPRGRFSCGGPISSARRSAPRRRLDHAINLLNAAGLAIFGAVGLQTCVNAGHGGNLFLCVSLGMTPGISSLTPCRRTAVWLLRTRAASERDAISVAFPSPFCSNLNKKWIDNFGRMV